MLKSGAVGQFFLRQTGFCPALTQNLRKCVQNLGVAVSHPPEKRQKTILLYEVFYELLG